jgi:hypothetical protein
MFKIENKLIVGALLASGVFVSNVSGSFGTLLEYLPSCLLLSI